MSIRWVNKYIKNRYRCKWGLRQDYFEATLWCSSYSSLWLRIHSLLSLALSNEAPICKWACPFSLIFSSSVFKAECGKVGVSIWQKCYSTNTLNSQDNVCMEGTIYKESRLLLQVYLHAYTTHIKPWALTACFFLILF